VPPRPRPGWTVPAVLGSFRPPDARRALRLGVGGRSPPSTEACVHRAGGAPTRAVRRRGQSPRSGAGDPRVLTVNDPKQTKVVLDESEMPTHGYNIVADLPTPPPPHLHPVTREPLTPADLGPLFPMGLIAQEASTERWIEIPQEVHDIYRL